MEQQEPVILSEVTVPTKKHIFLYKTIRFTYAALMITIIAASSTLYTLSRIKALNGDTDALAASLVANTTHVQEHACSYDPEKALPYSCDVTLGKDAVVTVHYDADKTLRVTEGTTELFTTKDQGYEPGFADVSFTNDINFDGYMDMDVVSETGAYNLTSDYYIYNPSIPSFVDELLSVVNPWFDATTKTITTHDKARGIGDEYTDDTYQFQSGTYVLIKTVTQDVADETAWPPTYIRTTKLLQNGKMVQVSKETLACTAIYTVEDCEQGH